MRGFAGLFAYLVGVSAIISIGVVGLMALRSPIERTSSTIAVESDKEPLAKPVKQTTVGQNVRITRKQPREASTTTTGDAYGYAQEPRRRIDPNLFPFFGR